MGAGNSSGQGSPGHKSQLMHDTKDQASVWREFGGLGHRREAPRCSPRRPARGDAEGSMSAPKALSPPWTAGVEGRPLTTHTRRCPEPFPSMDLMDLQSGHLRESPHSGQQMRQLPQATPRPLTGGRGFPSHPHSGWSASCTQLPWGAQSACWPILCLSSNKK